MTAGEELLYDTLNLLSELRQARADLADLRARAERAERERDELRVAVLAYADAYGEKEPGAFVRAMDKAHKLLMPLGRALRAPGGEDL